MTLAFAGFLVLVGLVLAVKHPTPIVPGFPFKQNQDAESLLLLAAFVFILPSAFLCGPRLADRIASGPNGSELAPLAAVLAGALAVVILVIKASGSLPWGDGSGALLGGCLGWGLFASAAIWRALQPSGWRILGQLPASGSWVAAGVLVFAASLSVTDLGSASRPVIGIGAVLLAGILAGYGRVRLPRPSRPWGLAIDMVLIVLVVLAVPDLVVVRPEDQFGSAAIPLSTSTIQFHQNFYLGPANSILHGKALLVDTVSQYGIGSVYLVAGWFKIAPIGYGTLGFLSGALSALVFAASYCILRIAGASRLLTASGIVVAIIVFVFGPTYPIDTIPQDSALRLGIPMVAILALVGGERWPGNGRSASVLALVVVALSSVWSFEAFAYTAVTVAAIGCAQAWLRPAGGRARWLAARALWALGACVCAHLLLAGTTLALTGHLPEWGQYFAYLDAFLFGHLGDLNYDYGRWPAGLAVGAVYLASALAVGMLLVRMRAPAESERVAVIAIVGLTAYGIVSYSYYNNRSSSFILAAVSLPALLAGVLWLSLALRSTVAVAPQARRAAIVFGSALAVVLVAVNWSSVGPRFPQSALAYAAPGGKSLSGALDRLWNFPPLRSAAPEGERLLDRYMPGQDRSLVIAKPDLEIEILFRSGRINVLPLASPWQDSFVPSVRLPDVERSVDDLRPGQRMLIDRNARRGFTLLESEPSLDPLAGDRVLQSLKFTPFRLAPLQLFAMKRLLARFDLRTIHRTRSGFEVVELVSKKPSAG